MYVQYSLLLCLSVIAFISSCNMLSSDALSAGVGSDLKHKIMQLVGYVIQGSFIIAYLARWSLRKQKMLTPTKIFTGLWQTYRNDAKH